MTKETASARGWKEIDRDTMPYAVATELLSRCGVRQTNKTRKQYQSARCRIFRSTAERKPQMEKTANRLHDATLLQLGTWLQRSWMKRRSLQRKWITVRALPQNPITQRILAAIDITAKRLAIFQDGLDDELQHRENLTQGKIDGDLLGVAGIGVFSWQPTCLSHQSRWVRVQVPNEYSPTYARR